MSLMSRLKKGMTIWKGQGRSALASTSARDLDASPGHIGSGRLPGHSWPWGCMGPRLLSVHQGAKVETTKKGGTGLFP